MNPIFFSFLLFCIGIYIILFRKNLIKIVMGIEIAETSANIFLISLGYKKNSVAPIFTNASSLEMSYASVQALVLTSIVIGLATTALMLSLCIMLKKSGNVKSSEEVCMKC